LLNFSNCPVTESEILDAISMLLPKKQRILMVSPCFS
jgi:hypothetical protein